MEPKAPLAHCDECPLADQPFVPGDGPDQTEIVIVGEAPGKIEVLERKPFVGQAGCLLNQELSSSNIHRSSVHVTNAVLCRPERNKKPSVHAIRACHDRLIREIELSGARKVLALGETATHAVARDSRPISKLREADHVPSPYFGDGVSVRVTYHPSWVWRNWEEGYPPFASDIRRLLDP